MTAPSLYRLLQISDSAFPRGAFAHSYGLETYVQEGTVTDAASLAEFVESVLLNNAGPLEGVYLREAWECSKNADWNRLKELECALSAAKPVASLREASQSVGRQFLRTAAAYIEDDFLRRYEREAREGHIAGHHAPAFGVITRALRISPSAALESYFYGTVSGLVSAAVRLIPLGQTDGQRVMASMEGIVAEAVREAMTRPLEEAWSFGPGHEIRAMSHSRLYTRLFVS